MKTPLISLVKLAQQRVTVRLGCFIVMLLLLWLPFAVPMYLLINDSNLISILTMVILYAEFMVLVKLWGKHIYQQPHIFRQYGLEMTGANALDFLGGVVMGTAGTLLMFWLQGYLGWLTWELPSELFPRIVLEGMVISLGIGFAEELFFRGWLLDELERDYKPTVALLINAIIFALAHFIKPWEVIITIIPQFPALVLLVLTQVWGKKFRCGRLGLPIGLHGGLVWGYYIINVGNLIRYSGKVPEWVTGVDGNPLQGILGVGFMVVLALQMWISQRIVSKT